MQLHIKASYICVAYLFNLRDAQADLIVTVETSLLSIKLMREQVHKLSRAID
jgi:hypothetical protein